MDFLILLALGMDATRNEATYVQPGNTRVDQFLGDASWRPRWASAAAKGHTFIRFLAEEYSAAMGTLGYLQPGLERMFEVKTSYNNMRLYYLAFFSRSEQGYKFWDQVRKYSDPQLDLLGG